MPTNRPGYAKEYYRRKRQTLIERLGGRCQGCGASENLDIHHRDGWKGPRVRGHKGRGRMERLADWHRTGIRRLKVFCQTCHREAEREKRERKKRGEIV